MASTLVWLAIPFVAWVLHRCYGFVHHYRIARTMGIPIVITPVSWQDDFWLLTWGNFQWIKRLPNFLSWWFDYSRFSWTQDHRWHPHEKYGDIFVITSPRGNEIMVNDPQACYDVQAHYKQWIKPQNLYDIFETFGRGVISANGDDWQRQRRIINPAFRESVHKLVWEESIKQATQMLDVRTNQHGGQGTIDDIRKDSVLIALHVLSSAGFGHTHDFSGGLRQVSEGHKKSFSESLMYLLSNILLVFLFDKIKPLGWMRPWKSTEIKDTVTEFRGYMKETVAYSRATTQGGGGGQANDIVGALIDADEAAKREEKIAPHTGFGAKPMHLTDDELYGNLYVFNLAGFETTANALTYTMPFLARNPEIQAWVGEEIDKVIQTGSKQEWTYENAFPSLVRSLAVMYETLRLWGPTPDVCRWAAGESQVMRVNGKDVVVPAGVYVSANFYGVHSDPRWWGNDSLEWNPKRWISVDPKTGQESIAQTPNGIPFLAWSIGPRICPGKRFSQVEFVAVIATLLKSYRIKPLVMGKMTTEEQAREALLDVVYDSENIITPKMRRPQDAGIIFVER